MTSQKHTERETKMNDYFTITYRHTGIKTYDFQVEYISENGEHISQKLENMTLHDLFINESYTFSIKTEKHLKLFKGRINNNPLYDEAVKENDKQLLAELKLQYRKATKEECSYLSELYGQKILPLLSKDFDRIYYVKKDDVFWKLLYESGYLILHRPYFGMKGNTRDVWEVNPYRKLGCDAAPTEAEAMTPDEYIKMAEDKSNVK